MNTAPDLLLTGGQIATLDVRQPRAEALAVTGARISAIGSTRQILSLRGPASRVIELQNAIVVPGLIDCPAPPALQSGEPAAVELDAFAPDVAPFIVRRADGMLLNRMALRAVGYQAAMPAPLGGYLVRDALGAPLGLVLARPTARHLNAILAGAPAAAAASLAVRLWLSVQSGLSGEDSDQLALRVGVPADFSVLAAPHDDSDDGGTPGQHVAAVMTVVGGRIVQDRAQRERA